MRPRTKAQADAAIALATEHGYSQMVTLGTMLRGWALIDQGDVPGGLCELQRGIEVWRATGTEDGRPYFLALLATAYQKEGRIVDGLALLDEAISIVEDSDGRVHEASLYQLKGELTYQRWQNGSSECPSGGKRKAKDNKQRPETTLFLSCAPTLWEKAEDYFQKALAVARQQQAKSLELRASTNLARLWQNQGKNKQAHKLLAGIYNWFTEGFDTKDLQEAKALLEELSH